VFGDLHTYRRTGDVESGVAHDGSTTDSAPVKKSNQKTPPITETIPEFNVSVLAYHKLKMSAVCLLPPDSTANASVRVSFDGCTGSFPSSIMFPLTS